MPDPVNLDDVSTEQLDAILNTITPSGEIEIPDAPAPAEASTAEPPAEDEVSAEQEPVADETPEPEQIDYRALYEQRAKELEEARAHASRLAGKVGFLEKKFQERGGDGMGAPPADDGPRYDPDPHAGDPAWGESFDERISRVEAELEASKQAEAQREQAQLLAIDARITAQADAMLATVPEDIRREAAAPFAQYWQDEVLGERDPERREQLGKGVVGMTIARAAALYTARQHERLVAQKTASTMTRHRAVQAAAISGGGSLASPPPKPVTAADLSSEEADKWLRENAR